MTEVYYLIPIAFALGGTALGAFMWSLRSGQYDDLAGAAERILFNEQNGPGRIESPAAMQPRRKQAPNGL